MTSDSAARVEAAYQQALALYRQGRLEDARLLCQRGLQLQPRHFDAWHLLGVIAARSNHPKLAAEFIGEALKIDPQNIHACRTPKTSSPPLLKYMSDIRQACRPTILERPDSPILARRSVGAGQVQYRTEVKRRQRQPFEIPGSGWGRCLCMICGDEIAQTRVIESAAGKFSCKLFGLQFQRLKADAGGEQAGRTGSNDADWRYGAQFSMR